MTADYFPRKMELRTKNDLGDVPHSYVSERVNLPFKYTDAIAVVQSTMKISEHFTSSKLW